MKRNCKEKTHSSHCSRKQNCSTDHSLPVCVGFVEGTKKDEVVSIGLRLTDCPYCLETGMCVFYSLLDCSCVLCSKHMVLDQEDTVVLRGSECFGGFLDQPPAQGRFCHAGCNHDILYSCYRIIT